MKLLVLSPVFPDAPSDGDRLRLYHWIRELGLRHEVHLACLANPARPADFSAGGLAGRLRSVHRVPWPLWRRRVSAGAGLLAGEPEGVADASSARMRTLVDALLSGQGRPAAAGRGPFDAVLAYRLKMAPYALRFRGPRFLDYTDCMTRYTERRAAALALEGRGLQAAYQRRKAERLAAFEAWCAGHFDAGFVNSGQDCATLRAMNPSAAAALRVAANGVDAAALAPPRAGRPPRDPRSLLFVGHLAYPPNADAAEWFARRVLPLVRAAEPVATFTIVGGDAPPRVAALAALPGVRLAGFAPDTRPHLWAAGLGVCPVRSGAGRQNKLLEAFAAGLPSVATSLAASGAEARDGRELLVADAAPDFARAVLDLLRRPALGRALAARALALVRRRYAWPDNAAVLERAMLEATRAPLW